MSSALVNRMRTVALSGVIILLAGQAHADGFGLGNFTVYGSNSVTINDGLNETTTCVGGNVGTGGTAAGSLSVDKCRIAGNVSVTTAPVLQLGSHGAYTGSLVTGSQTGVTANMSSISGNLGSLVPNLTLASLNNTNMIFTNASLTGGTYVVNVTGSATTTNPYTWTFAGGSADDRFVINIGGDMLLAQLNISLLGGISSNNVIFNLTGASCTARVNKSDSTWSGTILAPDCSVRVDNPFNFDGEVFGKDVIVDSGAVIIDTPSTPTPEPASIALLGSGLIGIAGVVRKRLIR
ncbi:MAG: hypothetical protein JWO20_1556 [Candidatus Angelobacter sp.]|nr:hypothetical protein [Candidatus Angelobacter sp.]